jgi:hypothetical protein
MRSRGIPLFRGPEHILPRLPSGPQREGAALPALHAHTQRTLHREKFTPPPPLRTPHEGGNKPEQGLSSKASKVPFRGPKLAPP